MSWSAVPFAPPTKRTGVNYALQSKGDWSEYETDNGRKYYYNKTTGITQWDKPAEMKSNNEMAMASSPWKEFVSDTGRRYYYNSATKESTWEEPTDHKALREAQEADNRMSSPTSAFPRSPNTNSPTNGETDDSKKLITDYKTQEERVMAFKRLLADAGVTSTWTWDMTMRVIANDERYKILKTLSEKKQVLQEYQAERKQQEREDKRRKDNKAREAFVQMLRENSNVTPKIPWRKAAVYFEGDNRFEAIPERDREELYEEFLIEKEKQEKESVRQLRRDNMKRFRQKLESDITININSQWRKIKEQFKEDETFKVLDKIDRLQVFEDYIRDLERDEEDKKREEIYHKKRSSRKTRDSFRGLLQEKLEQGQINIHTKWKDFQKVIRDDERYKNMLSTDQTGSLPSELFGDFLDTLEDQYYKEKKKIKEILKELGITITPSSDPDNVIAEMSKSPKFASVDSTKIKQMITNSIKKVDEDQKKKDKEAEKKKKKSINAFIELLFNCKQIKFNSSWSEIRELIKDDAAFQAISSEEERAALFQDFITRKQEDTSDEEGRIRSESPKDKKKEKKHKKSSSSTSKKEKKHKHHKKHHRDEGSDDSEEEDQSKRRKKDNQPPPPPPSTSSDKSAMDQYKRDSSPEEGEAR